MVGAIRAGAVLGACLALGVACERPVWGVSGATFGDPVDLRDGDSARLLVSWSLGGEGRPTNRRYFYTDTWLYLDAQSYVEECFECDGATLSASLSEPDLAARFPDIEFPVPAGWRQPASFELVDLFVECERRDACPGEVEILLEMTGPNLVEITPSAETNFFGYGQRATLGPGDIQLSIERLD